MFRESILALLSTAATLTIPAAVAQGWPAKPIRFVVNFAAGGGTESRVLALPEFKDRFEGTGTVLVGNSPDAFARVIKNDYDRWGKVIRAAGTKAE